MLEKTPEKVQKKIEKTGGTGFLRFSVLGVLPVKRYPATITELQKRLALQEVYISRETLSKIIIEIKRHCPLFVVHSIQKRVGRTVAAAYFITINSKK